MNVTNKERTIHFFTKGDKNCGSSRQRAFLVAEKMTQQGIKTIVHEPSNELISKTRWPGKFKLLKATLVNLLQIKHGDIIFLQRTIYNKYFLIFVVAHKIIFRRKIVFDFGDSIFIHSFLKTAILTKLSDVVIVGSHYLESWSKKYNQNVYLIPTSIDFASYSGHSQKQENGNSKIVVGWIGGATYHYENLKLLVPVFKELVERDLQFKFLLVGALKDQRVYKMFGEIKGLETEMVDELKWSVSGIIPQTIKNFDIGVMPLVNDEWSKGKCSFKAVEYMACSVPAVISLVGENNYLVKNGVNGFVASSTKEWVEAITKLCDDSLLRIKMGKEAERTIANEYSFEANVPKLIKIINSL